MPRPKNLTPHDPVKRGMRALVRFINALMAKARHEDALVLVQRNPRNVCQLLADVQDWASTSINVGRAIGTARQQKD